MAANSRWLHQLDDGELLELSDCVEASDNDDSDLPGLGRDAFPLPRLGVRLAQMREQVLRGCGVVQLRGLPVARWGRRRAAIAFWAIAAHLGDDVVSQNAKGHLLGHVKDFGQRLSESFSRGPYTRERIEYHSDACDVVGLLCLQPSRSGGESSLVSAWAVYNRMLERRPDLVAALCEPVYRDRRGEIPEGKEPWYAMPVFHVFDDYLAVSNEPSYVASVARFFETDPNTPAQHEALAMLDAVSDELRLDIPFEVGDMQFINNHTVLHSRQAFEDFDDPQRKRHLLRIWLSADDGPRLPEAYFARNGDPLSGRRPGGIWGRDTVAVASLDGL